MDTVEVIGIDHGWSTCKTIADIFISGVKEMSTEPAFCEDVVEYRGKYFKIGGQRLEVKDTKVQNDNYYILTLAAIAKELIRRGKRKSRVILAVGLPLTRFGAEKKEFINYLRRQTEVQYKFAGQKYYVTIEKVLIFPQCYAAIADKIGNYEDNQLIVDIGSWTIDIMPVENMLPVEAKCKTIPKGLITCMRDINEELVRKLNGEVSEFMIQTVIVKGTANMNPAYLKVIQEGIRTFAERIYDTLKEIGYNYSTTPVIFVGGGATVMKRYGSIKDPNITYLEDIKANAKGYEYLANMYLSK